MRFSIFSLFALASITVAQIPGLPQCAGSCVSTGYGGCSAFDVKCICSNQQYLSGLACCVSKQCDAADQAKTIQFADALCASYNVNDLPQSATCADAAAASTLSSASTSGIVTAAALGASTPSLGPSVSSVLASLSASLHSKVVSGSTSAPPAATTPAGSGASKIEGGALGLAIAGILAVL